VTLRPTVRAEVDAIVNHALGMSEPGPRTTSVSNHQPAGALDHPPRIPAIGLHPGAIQGSIPHRQTRLDRWTR
jgi:hypothetical protein